MGGNGTGQRYVLTVQNSSIFKEVEVHEGAPLVRIGTLQDCDVRLKRELFDMPVRLELRFEGGEWRLSCGEGLLASSRAARDCGETALRHGDILGVHAAGGKAPLLSLAFAYDFSGSSLEFDTIIDIRNAASVVIGGGPGAQLGLGSRFAGGESVTLSRGRDGRFALDASRAPNSATLNGVRLFGSAAVQDCDFIGVADYSFYFKNQVLYTAMRPDLRISGLTSQPLRDETPAFDYPKLNRGPRLLYAPNAEPIEILNPPKKPERPRDNLIMQLSPALLMIAVTVVTRSGLIGGLSAGGSPAFLIFSLSTMAVGIFTSVLSFAHSRRRHKKDLAAWNEDYAAYIARKRREIEAERQRERAALLDAYPSAEQARDFVKTFSGRLFERSPADADFLHARAGLGAVPALREIECRREEHVKADNELMELPERLRGEYALISGAPVMLRLREAGTVGVVGPPQECYEFFKSLLLDVCVAHSYEDVQIVALVPRAERRVYEWVKWLPHAKESCGGMRGIVCDDESRDGALEHLYALMSERAALAEGGGGPAPLPHYVVFVLEDYGIRSHPLSQYAAGSSALGLSFVCFSEHMESLPQECAEIVELSPGGGTLRLRGDKEFARPFARERVRDDSISFAAERLAPVFCEKIALSSRLTSSVTLFELLNIISPEDLDLAGRWAKSSVQKSMSAPLGVDAKGGRVELDLHERAHGPHGLVAGTTGSGKSEIMQSYMLSAAASFHPYEVSFVVIDFKGGGMANQFERLPHLIGKITDIDSHEIERSLLSIRAELEKRKRLFAERGVNHIDQYIAKFRSGEAKIPLPHLILIVDEFAELKAEQPEFMKELVSAARVGRSLGMHLILATQKPAGQVSEQIWSNSRFRLCLKVATKEDSNEMLRSPLASEIREPGRAYLQVGNNEIFELFQSAYSGASAISDRNGSTREFSIAEVSLTGRRTAVCERRAERPSGGRVTQLRALVDYMEAYCAAAGIARLPSICPPPLPEIADYAAAGAMGADGMNAAAGAGGMGGAGAGLGAGPGAGGEIRIGIYDDPASQAQPMAGIRLSEGNVMIIGSAQTGKTTLLQTMLRGIAESASPRQISVYILDLASKILKIYEGLGHVGCVLTDADDEKLKNFFKMIREEIDARKELFSQMGASSYEAYTEMGGSTGGVAAGGAAAGAADGGAGGGMGTGSPGIAAVGAGAPDMPRIVIMIDNLATFKDVFPDYEDALLNICREGLALGVTVVATAKQTSGLSYRYMSNFATRLAFCCTEASEYGSIFDRCQIRPKNLQGRGLVSVDKTVYEYQAFLPFDGLPASAAAGAAAAGGAEERRSESRRIEQAKAFMARIASAYGGERARPVPSIPPVLTEGWWKRETRGFGAYAVPVGLTYSEIEPVTVDLARVGSVGICGREGSGKSGLLRTVLRHLQRHVFDMPCEAHLIDGYDRQLAEFGAFGFVERLTVDAAEFEGVVQRFSDAAKERMETLRDGGSLESEPLLLCVVQNRQVFAAGAVDKAACELFKKLLADARQLKICFIFSDVENSQEYSPPEMLRIARDFGMFFLLDDLANIRLFGTGKFSPGDLKAHKKPIALGDGYVCDARGGLDKVKLVKCDKSDKNDKSDKSEGSA